MCLHRYQLFTELKSGFVSIGSTTLSSTVSKLGKNESLEIIATSAVFCVYSISLFLCLKTQINSLTTENEFMVRPSFWQGSPAADRVILCAATLQRFGACRCVPRYRACQRPLGTRAARLDGVQPFEILAPLILLALTVNPIRPTVFSWTP